MGRAVNSVLWMVAVGLAFIPTIHVRENGVAAGFISLLAICILIDVAGWVFRR